MRTGLPIDTWRRAVTAAALIVAATLAAPTAAGADVPTPTVTPAASDRPGTSGRNYPFFATDIVLADYDFVEQEFFFEGRANTYSTPALGSNAEVVTSGTPYRSRMLVRRPARQ